MQNLVICIYVFTFTCTFICSYNFLCFVKKKIRTTFFSLSPRFFKKTNAYTNANPFIENEIVYILSFFVNSLCLYLYICLSVCLSLFLSLFISQSLYMIKLFHISPYASAVSSIKPVGYMCCLNRK